jgi:hemerythrin-like domain-containing protein
VPCPPLSAKKVIRTMIEQPYVGATKEQLEHPLVAHFLEVHDMFRSELSKMLRLISDVTNGQPLAEQDKKARIHALIRTGTQYNTMLHHHHHGESAMLFPPLMKEDPNFAPIKMRLEAEHDEIAVLIDNFSDAIHSAPSLDLDSVDADLRRLSDALQAHLAYEEEHVCPLLAHFSDWSMR